MNESDIKNAVFKDFTVLENDGKRTLILICDDKETAIKLYCLLKNNYYALKIEVKPNREYIINLDFVNEPHNIILDTHRTELGFMAGNINYLTTGINGTDNKLQWYEDYLEKLSPRLNFC